MIHRESFEDGKYEVRFDEAGRLTALRNGEEWRDLTGDGLVLAMLQEVARRRDPRGRDPAETRWMDMEEAIIEAIGVLTHIEVIHQRPRTRSAVKKAVVALREKLLKLADELQDTRHEWGHCPGPGHCAACDVEAEEDGQTPAVGSAT